MTLAHSSKRKKPAKPRRDYPLFAHASGQWAKKVNGKLHYFGVWADPGTAERLWDAQKEDLRAGREPSVTSRGEALTVKDAVNYFLEFQRPRVTKEAFQSGDLPAGKLIVAVIGSSTPLDDIGPRHFTQLMAALEERFNSPHTRSKYVKIIRHVFRWAMEQELTDKHIRFGPAFVQPTMKTIRQHDQGNKLAHGSRDISREDCHTFLDNASPQMKAWLLLGLNAAFGPTDIVTLQRGHLDGDWVRFPRSKTAIEREAFLWPETVAALEAYRLLRPAPVAGSEGYVFINSSGQPYVARSLGNAFRKFGKTLGIHRPGSSFYRLRHTFRTQADSCQDSVAIDRVMGHADASMGARYRHSIEPDRLIAVSKHVHQWLFGSEGGDR